jgi:hypothetical protein
MMLMAFTLGPGVAGAGDSATKAALLAGGTRLVALQNPDGGWYWVVGDTDCGAGPGVSCPNTIGVTALGLVSAYAITKTPAFKTAALKSADYLVALHNAAPPCDGNATTGDDRPITADIAYLLLGAGRLSGSSKYPSGAKAWFQCVELDFPDAADRADNRIQRRIDQGIGNLGAWDAALDMRAALAFQTSKEGHYALAEAARIIARQGDWDYDDPDCAGCEILSKGLLVKTLWGKRASSAALATALKGWIADLVASQDPDGSWGGDTQTTAYAAMGLGIVDTSAAKAATKKAVVFLKAQQNLSGGFAISSSDPTEITEVDSEVLQFLADQY